MPAGRTASGATIRVTITGDRITDLTPTDAPSWLWLPIIDSHVHLSYWPVATELAASGVEAVVDLAAPEATLDHTSGALHVLAAGPMLTHPDGYPLDGWGHDRYGISCSDAATVTATIDRLVRNGAQVIKLALDDDGLAPSLVETAVTAAHAHHRKVAAHALSDAAAALAGRAGVDILAHTPIEPLTDATVALWRNRAVISTLAAFGGRPSAIDNLRRLRAAGATVLYGTDLGNTRVAGPNPSELTLLRRAGLDDAAITAAMTTTPTAYWNLPFALTAGAEATFLLLDADPRLDASVLLSPRAAWLHGHRVR